jgi:3-deoxy-D-manno-octulosonic-acid transferase
MRWFYNSIFFVFAIFSLPKTLKRQRKSPEYRGMISRRYKVIPIDWKEGFPKLWLNAVSVGETIALGPLVKEIEQAYPGIRLLISATTGTGYHRAKALYPEHHIIGYPYDFSFVVDKFLTAYQPDCFISCELDLWPNFLLGCQKFKVPFIVVSGRISDSSIKGYKKVRPLIYRALEGVSLFLAQDVIDEERAKEIGFVAVKQVGNLKFDLLQTDPEPLPEEFKSLKRDREKFLVIASTHHPEEAYILDALNSIGFWNRQDWKLILVPRHPERKDQLAAMLDKVDKSYQFYSQISDQNSPLTQQILLVDQIGVLAKFYQLSDLCFIGGSLIPHGGQNMIEPAALGCAVFFGPHVHNFREASELLLSNQAAVQVKNAQELKQFWPDYLDDLQLSLKLSTRAKEAILSQRGVAKRTLQELKTFLED